MIFKQRQNGFSIVEMLVTIIIAAIVLVAVYQTVILQWNAVETSANSAKITGETKRVLEIVAKRLRNSGYNPLSTIYTIDNSLTKRFGIMAAYQNQISFSQDTSSPTEAISDGIINTTNTLDSQLMPVAGKTNGNEIGAFKVVDRQLLGYVSSSQNGQWQILAKGVEAFRLQYYAEDGKEMTVASGITDPRQLHRISRITVYLKIEQGAGKNRISGEGTTSITLRNQPIMPATN